MRVFTRFLSIFLKEIDVLKAKTLKIFASGGSFLKGKKSLRNQRYLNLKRERNKGVFLRGVLSRNSRDTDPNLGPMIRLPI